VALFEIPAPRVITADHQAARLRARLLVVAADRGDRQPIRIFRAPVLREKNDNQIVKRVPVEALGQMEEVRSPRPYVTPSDSDPASLP